MKRFLVCLTILSIVSCTKTEEMRIPYRQVYLELDLDFQDKDLVAVNNSKTYTKQVNAFDKLGFGGVIVYHSPYGGFVAYDLACPYEAEAGTKVAVDPESAGVYVVCPKCKSRYELANGFAEPGSISSYRLQQYEIRSQTSSKLIVQH